MAACVFTMTGVHFFTFPEMLPALRGSLILVHSTWIALCQIKIHLLPLRHYFFSEDSVLVHIVLDENCLHPIYIKFLIQD